MKVITFDAKNKSLGRIACQAAAVLRGKTSAEYLPNVAPKTKVRIINISMAKTTGKKLEQKKYKKYSGYPGSLRYIPMEKMMKKNPKEFFKKVVFGMLPKNKIAKIILKNLEVEL